jgi:O-antigen/teichoic acid export membrane protein
MNASADTVASPPEKHERQSANWDISNAPKNYLLLVLAQFGGAFFAFASVWLLSRRIGSEGYGGVVAIIAASQVAQILINWTSIAVVRFGVEEFVETGRIAHTFWLRFFVLAPNILLVVLAANHWFPPLAGWLKLPAESFWFVILHFSASALWIHVQFGLQGAKLPRIQGFFLMLERFLILVGIGVLLGLGSLTPLSALLSYSVAPLLMTAAGIIYLRRYLFSRFSIDLRFVKKIVAFSLPLLPFSLIGYFSGSYVDAIFVSNFLSTRDLGIYSIATQIAGIVLQLPTLANSLLLPMFVSLQKESENQKTLNYFQNILPSLTLFWGIACTVISFVGFMAIPLIFDAEFRVAIIPLWILLSASVLTIPAALGYSPLSNSTSTTYISMLAAIFSAVTNITANFMLIPRYGMIGCAWATLMAYFVGVLTFALLLRRSAKIQLSWTFLATLPCISGAVFFTFYQNPWLPLILCLIVSFLVSYLYRTSLQRTFSFLKNMRMGMN